jgi:hypothetical protein
MAKLTEAQKRKNFEATVGSSENDMGPTNPGVEMLRGVKASEEAAKNKDAMERALLKGAKEGMGGKSIEKALGMKKGGKVKAPTMTFQTYTKTGKEAGLKTVPAKKMATGGKVSQLAKANGCAVKGKSKGRII